MTRRRRRLLIPIIHLITRIYLHIVFAPIMFALHSHSVSIKVVSCPCLSLVRDRLLHFATPLTDQKFHIIKLLSPSPLWVLSACTLYIMYYQTCRFCLICTNTSYVTLDFHTIHPDPSTSFFFFIVCEVVLSLFVVIMRVLTGVDVFFPSRWLYFVSSIKMVSIAVELSLLWVRPI